MKIISLISTVFFLSALNTTKSTSLSNTNKIVFFSHSSDYCDLVDNLYTKNINSSQVKYYLKYEIDEDAISHQILLSKSKESIKITGKRNKSLSISIQAKSTKLVDRYIDTSHTYTIPSETKALVSTKNTVSWQASRNKINNTIIEALENYRGPELIVTSGHRHWGGPDHRKGHAVDIHYTIDVLNYLTSEVGEAFLNLYNLEFFVEDKKRKTKNDIPNNALPHWRWIPWATGLHIHLNLK